MGSITDQTLEIVRRVGVLRPKDLEAHGIPRVYLQRLVEQGALQKLGRDLYALPGAPAAEVSVVGRGAAPRTQMESMRAPS